MFKQSVISYGKKLKVNNESFFGNINTIPRISAEDSKCQNTIQIKIISTIINQGFSLKYLLECDEDEIRIIEKEVLKPKERLKTE